jgi:hypothetical protein
MKSMAGFLARGKTNDLPVFSSSCEPHPGKLGHHLPSGVSTEPGQDQVTDPLEARE